MNSEKSIRILHVEDNPVEARLLRAIMKNGGGSTELIQAERLDQAIARCATEDFDVVLLDLTLPDAQGWETVKRAQAAMPRVPIVVLTSLDDEGFGMECAGAGVQDYLLKGEVNGAALRRIIAYAIERKRVQETLRASEQELAEHRNRLEKLLRDRTSELTRLNEQLLQAQKMEAVGRLTGGIAHDFNNLLSMMSGYAAFLMESLDSSDPRRSDAEGIRDTLGRAATLTRQLLTFSRKRPVHPAALDLNAVLVGLDGMIRRLIGEHIKLNTRVDSAPCWIRADSGQVEQILLNLAINACDAMPKGGTLTLSTASQELDDAYAASHPDVKPGRYAMLSVSDTGCGMTAETLSHLFEPFFTTKEEGKGTGLGLATVYSIVKRSEGHIDVSSEPGQGATFKVYFPQIEEPAPKAEAANSPAGSWGGKETILFVEDEPVVRALARRTLEGYGYTVLEASDGLDALKLSQEYKSSINLLVTDVVMPSLGGIDLVDRMAALRPEIKVLFLSGYSAETIPGRHVEDPPVSFLPKPFSPRELAKKARETLDSSSVPAS